MLNFLKRQELTFSSRIPFLVFFTHASVFWILCICGCTGSLRLSEGAPLELWGLGFSLRRLLLWSTSCRRVGLIVEVLGLSCPEAHRSFLDQGSSLCPLHWQMDSCSLDHQGRFYILVSIQAEHRSEGTAQGSKQKSTVWALLKAKWWDFHASQW